MEVDDVLETLYLLADPKVMERKAKRFGIRPSNTPSIGLFMKDINAVARECPKDAELALTLFDTELYEARILCCKIFPPGQLTDEIAEKWVMAFDTWEMCDAFCASIFAPSPLAFAKIYDWKDRRPEFEKRAAFATMASYCHTDKRSDNSVFLSFLPWIVEAASDDRTYVKKAVHWALRSIGKRNIDLHLEALTVGHALVSDTDQTKNWVGRQALAELDKPHVRMSNYPRLQYANKSR